MIILCELNKSIFSDMQLLREGKINTEYPSEVIYLVYILKKEMGEGLYWGLCSEGL